jgi:hypothetical protein
MTETKRERDLRELFARLREEDRARTPPFYASVVARAQQRRPRSGWALRAAVAAAAVLVIALGYELRQTAVRRERARAEVRRPLLARPGWAAPTDFLLNTPGSRLLHTVPTFGSGSWIRPRPTNLGTRNPS